MSDPLSIAASVAGLLTITAQIATGAKTLYDGVKEAPQSIAKIEEEMEALHMIFCQVQMFLIGAKRHNPSRLTMVSLNHLTATLSSCILVCSNLDKKLSEVTGLRGMADLDNSLAQAPGGVNQLFFVRVRWALWEEAEAADIIDDLQRHKLSLALMLNIIQCNSSSEAFENLAQLHDVVAQILDSNRTISTQLRELIRRQDEAMGIPTVIKSDYNYNTTTAFSASLTSDNASIRTIASTFSVRSMQSIIPFAEELKNSRAYKRLRYMSRSNPRSQQSIFTVDSSVTRGDSWSMLSDMSLGGLSISEIAVLELPISMGDVYDPAPYQESQQELLQPESTSKTQLGDAGQKRASKERLHNAVRNNNLLSLRTLLTLGMDINEIDGNGSTALSLAAKLGNWSVVKYLLDRGASVDIPDMECRTPLTYAIMANNIGICELLLCKAAFVDMADVNGRTPLSYAAALESVLYDSLDSFGRTPLSTNEPSVCELLLDRGASVDSLDSLGRTPLSYAATNDRSVCELLLDRGASVDSLDSLGRTPLSYAATNDRSVCELLLDRGASIDSLDSLGRTPLSHAAISNKSEIFSFLLGPGGGALSDIRDSAGRTPVSYLAASRIYIHRVDDDSLSPSALDLVDSKARAPLSYAAESRSEYAYEFCEFLLKRGASANRPDITCRTPLSYAATCPTAASHKICEELLFAGASVDFPDITGRTPLSHAAGTPEGKYNDNLMPTVVNTCILLLQRGADPYSKDVNGKTPLDYAVECNNFKTIEVLKNLPDIYVRY